MSKVCCGVLGVRGWKGGGGEIRGDFSRPSVSVLQLYNLKEIGFTSFGRDRTASINVVATFSSVPGADVNKMAAALNQHSKWIAFYISLLDVIIPVSL